jgi:DNA-binding transcriptional ArsR family regulator
MTRLPSLGSARRELDRYLAAPTKLTNMSVLVHLDDVEFGALGDATDISDSALSKQLSSLEEIGYLTPA